jgi:hypothetical protein
MIVVLNEVQSDKKYTEIHRAMIIYWKGFFVNTKVKSGDERNEKTSNIVRLEICQTKLISLYIIIKNTYS